MRDKNDRERLIGCIDRMNQPDCNLRVIDTVR